MPAKENFNTPLRKLRRRAWYVLVTLALFALYRWQQRVWLVQNEILRLQMEQNYSQPQPSMHIPAIVPQVCCAPVL